LVSLLSGFGESFDFGGAFAASGVAGGIPLLGVVVAVVGGASVEAAAGVDSVGFSSSGEPVVLVLFCSPGRN
jgi:hypothetical protein